MQEYIVSFAGLHVAIQYDTEETYRFLSFLFGDVQGETDVEIDTWVTVIPSQEAGEYTLTDTGVLPYTGVLGVRFAALLFDAVIFNLLNKSSNGIAFHAGAVAYGDQVIMLPGLSGFGKSSMTGCLLTSGYSYLTDELYFVPVNAKKPCLSFTRPLCIKTGSATAIRRMLSDEQLEGALADMDGLVIPHRLINKDFSPVFTLPSLILIPKFHPDAKLHIEKLSAAQATAQLMACNVNGRNLKGHGFPQMVSITRSTPVYRIHFNSFQGVDGAMASLLDELGWTR